MNNYVPDSPHRVAESKVTRRPMMTVEELQALERRASESGGPVSDYV